MRKLTIPAILAATIMVAGAFAFMPVEQATTVHTAIQSTQATVQAAEDLTDRTAAGATDVARITIGTDNNDPFHVVSLIVCATAESADADGDPEIEITDITIDGDELEVAAGTALTVGPIVAANTADTLCLDAIESISNANTQVGERLSSDGGDIVIDLLLEEANDVLTQAKAVAIVDGDSTLEVTTSLP